MKSEHFVEEITNLIKKVFSIQLKDEVIFVLRELVESYHMLGNLAGSPVGNFLETLEEPVLTIKRIFKGKNQKEEDVLLIYFEDAHGIILNLTDPSKSQIGTLPKFAF